MNIALIFVLLNLFGMATAGVPLSPQAQQANPNTQVNNPYGYANQVTIQGMPQFQTGNIVYTVIAVLVTLFVIIFSLILLVRYHQMQTAYVGDGRRIDGRIRCFIWGIGWFDFRATEVSQDEIEETLKIISEIDEIKEKKNLTAIMNSIVEKVHEGKLHLYEIKVISRRNMRIRGNFGYSILISSEAIDDRKFFYQSRNAVLSPFSGTWKEHPKIIDCIAQSRIYPEVEMADRDQTTTVYVIGPVSGDFATNKKQIFGQNLEEFQINPVSINVNLIEMKSEIGEVLTIMRTVADTYKTSSSLKKGSKIMQEINEKLSDELVEKNAENTLMKSKVGERALVILGEKVLQKLEKDTWMWLLAAIIMGFVGIELPQGIQQLSTTNPSITFGVCEAFVLILKVLSDSQKKDPYEKYRDKNQSITMGSGQNQPLR